MIESCKVEHFRCFSSIELKELKRVNLVVGRNATGKTTLLEALFIACSNSPEVALRLRAWRGMGDIARIAFEASSAETLWGDLFNNFDRSRSVSVTLRGTQEHNRSLRIDYQSAQRSTTLRSKVSPDQQIKGLPIRFTWKTSRGENLVVTPEITRDGLKIGSIGSAAPGVFFHSSAAQAPQEVADRFSSLSRRNEEGAVVNAMRSEFPFLQGLSVELNAGVPMVYAAVTTVQEKLPLGLVSSGVNKLLAMLVAIVDSKGGAIFVDEVDNGFYFDRLSSMWQLVRSFCEVHDCQLFCTTHSRECIESLREAITGHEDSFSLIRVDGNAGQAKSFRGNDLLAAINEHAELR